jgi:hypothetical protein
MYTQKLKERIGGYNSSFVMKGRELIQSDLNSNQLKGILTIPYLVEAITEKRCLERLVFIGDKKYLSIHFCQGLTVGLVVTPGTNMFVLDFTLKKIIESLEHPEMPEKPLSILEELVPYFDRPKDQVILNVPEYARQVLEFVDGKRTVRDIIAQSNLSREEVLDVITAYRRSSVIHYKS